MVAQGRGSRHRKTTLNRRGILGVVVGQASGSSGGDMVGSVGMVPPSGREPPPCCGLSNAPLVVSPGGGLLHRGLFGVSAGPVPPRVFLGTLVDTNGH